MSDPKPIDRGIGQPCPDCGLPWPCGLHRCPTDPERITQQEADEQDPNGFWEMGRVDDGTD